MLDGMTLNVGEMCGPPTSRIISNAVEKELSKWHKFSAQVAVHAASAQLTSKVRLACEYAPLVRALGRSHGFSQNLSYVAHTSTFSRFIAFLKDMRSCRSVCLTPSCGDPNTCAQSSMLAVTGPRQHRSLCARCTFRRSKTTLDVVY